MYKKGAREDMSKEERDKIPDWISEDDCADYFYKCTMIYCIQIILIAFILHAAFNDEDSLRFAQPTLKNMVVRLLMAYMLHLGNYKEVSESYKKLKFLRTFPERFSEDFIMPAAMVTFYHFSASIFIEFANIVFLTRQRTLVEMMMTYVAFLGVSHLDELYVEATHKMKSAKLILDAKGEELKMRDDAISWTKFVEPKAGHNDDSHSHGGEE